MIVGIGTDIIDTRRIEKVINKYGSKFKNRCFSTNEIKRSENKLNTINSYAKRYAAKEACAKALGTGLARGVYWKDIEVINLPSGKPTINLEGGALKILKSICPINYFPLIEISITDDKKLAMAIVIISAELRE